MALAEPTTDEVRLIIPGLGSSATDAVISAFIRTAVLLAGRCTAVAGYETDLQKEIVKFVAAHFLSIGHASRGGPITQKTLGDASESYASSGFVGGKGLNATFYGQQAIALDESGCLEKVGKMKAKFEVL